MIFKNMSEFRKAHPSEYNCLYINGWLDRFRKDMGWKLAFHRGDGYWEIKENVLKEALKYQVKSHWMQKSPSSYKYAKKNYWVEECTAHMKQPQKPAGYWNNKINCIESAKQFNSIKKWSRTHYGAWENAKKNGWFEECTAHMKSSKYPAGYWNNKINCIESAKQFGSVKGWYKVNYGAWENAKKNGWFEECTAHMISSKYEHGYWTKERCMENALKFNTKNEWQKSLKNSYAVASRNGWFEECTAHMTPQKRPKSYWTKERCIEEASKYKNISEWYKGSSSSYKVVRENKWDDEIKEIFKIREINES